MSTSPRPPAQRTPTLDQTIIALDEARPGTFNHLLLRLLKRQLECQPELWWDDEGVQR
jgi:hypothetical protein